MKKEIIIALIPSMILAIIIPVIMMAEAQELTQDRVFVKDFCQEEETLLDDIIYTNGEEISYDSSGCPESVKIIHRWNELSLARQTLITSRLATNGYEDVTETLNSIRGNSTQ